MPAPPIGVARTGDRLADVETFIGYRIASDPDVDEAPDWEWISAHPVAFVLSDDGGGIGVLVPRVEGIDPVLMRLCAAEAEPAAGDAGHGT